ncbi:DUF1883 domain-containing protein [Denitrificimonas sp. JX-1]|uniref:DUF1883 domain-containing protein n=1 Tax=Denitrificimonas halotolerans TaxID=3098930 RepID=A0ABU5GPH6_9GAMM|nr:DUF1883 domain-containing protein [Denitrificimonas sp. JX-1]MDY7218898.1 DUF1883 domain-containing protein [Denitrificimonas sp. JX-1]
MKFVHHREFLNEDDTVVIHCSKTCNIRLMNDRNFRSYKNGGRHTYYGGAFEDFPARIKVPSTANWNITIDTMNHKGISTEFTHKLKIIRNKSK